MGRPYDCQLFWHIVITDLIDPDSALLIAQEYMSQIILYLIGSDIDGADTVGCQKISRGRILGEDTPAVIVSARLTGRTLHPGCVQKKHGRSILTDTQTAEVIRALV